MIETAPALNIVVPVVAGQYTTHPLQFGVVNFDQPESFSSPIVSEIILQIEPPARSAATPINATSFAVQYLPPQIEFFRRFDQWFVTVLLNGKSFPLTPLYLLLTHFDRVNRKVYTARGTLTLTKYI